MASDLPFKFVHITAFFSCAFMLFVTFAFGGPQNSFHFDEATWAYIGRVWISDGLRPYVDAFDNKTPGIFLLHAVSYALFGLNFWFPRIVASGALAFTALIVSDIAWIMTRHRAVTLLSGSIFVSSCLWKSFGWRFVSETESFVILFTSLAYWLILRHRDMFNWRVLFLAGVSLGFAIGFKQTALVTIAGMTLCLFVFLQLSLLSCIPFATGALMSFAAVSLPIIVSGVDTWTYLYHSWVLIFISGSAGPVDYDLQWRLNRFVQAFFSRRIVLFYPMLAAVWIFRNRITNRSFFMILLTWLGFEFLALNVSGSYATHHFRLLAPPLSIMAAMAVMEISQWLNVRFRIRPQFVLVACLFLWFPFYFEIPANIYHHIAGREAWDGDCHISEPFPNDGQQKSAGRWIRDHTNAGDRIYIAGASAIVTFYSERVSSSRFFSTFPIPRQMEDVFALDLEEYPPVLLLIPFYQGYNLTSTQNVRRILDNFILHKKYILSGCINGYDIYAHEKSFDPRYEEQLAK